MKCLRAIMGISLRQELTNDEIRRRADKQPKIEEILRINRLRWLGHVKRMSHTRTPLQLLYGKLAGTRPRHGTNKRWTDKIQEDLKHRKLNAPWYEVAQNRPQWRKVVKGEALPLSSARTARAERRSDRKNQKQEDSQETQHPFACSACGTTCKSKQGLSLHQRRWCGVKRKLGKRRTPT